MQGMNEGDVINAEILESLEMTVEEIQDYKSLPDREVFQRVQELGQTMIIPEIHYWTHTPFCRYTRGDRFIKGNPQIESYLKIFFDL